MAPPVVSPTSPLSHCPGCAAVVDPAISLSCDGCERSVHYSCLGLLPEDAGALKRIHGRTAHVKILCGDCSGGFKIPLYHHFVRSSPIGELYEDMVKGVVKTETNVIHEQIESLKQTVENFRLSNVDMIKLLSNDTKIVDKNAKKPSAPTPSYSDIASKANKKLIIKPKDAKQTVIQTKNDIVKNVSAVKTNLNIKAVKQIASGGVIITCSPDDATKIENIATDKMSNNYTVSKLRTIHPRVRIAGVSNILDQEAVLSCLLRQNNEVFDSVTHCTIIKFWETKKNRDIKQFILELDSTTYNKLMSVKSVLIGLNSCPIYDDLNVIRCYKCSGFNHTQATCSSAAVCPLCAGSHLLKDCKVDSRDKDNLKCINCKLHNDKLDSDTLKCDHAAWNISECQMYKNMLNKIKKDVFGISIMQSNQKN